MSYISGIDYNVMINTPRFIITPLRSKDTEQLLALCSKPGFSYSYIHSNPKNQHLSLQQRVADYAELGDHAAKGKFGRTMIQAVRKPEGKNLLAVIVLFATEAKSTLFRNPDPEHEREIGAFVDIDHWKKEIATEGLHAAIGYGVDHWGLTGLHASFEPSRKGNLAIVENLGMEFVEHIPAGSDRVPYNDDFGNPAARHIYRTPQGWTF